MCVYMFKCICVFIYACIQICMYTHMCTSIYKHILYAHKNISIICTQKHINMLIKNTPVKLGTNNRQTNR